MSFKEMLDGKLIEETAGHFDESDMAMYRAGAAAALELLADEAQERVRDFDRLDAYEAEEFGTDAAGYNAARAVQWEAMRDKLRTRAKELQP